ncbi:TetR/AcrR family transcriptional regulator [Aurantimicrobium sp. MWH-Uga1]|uniref:TetR/AcrR family transcriptional regulator n=1 Tax=Aurantimicrobium sp. MWH-Uga1 TaxID=2079575 RepID=UPI000DEDBC38|nr:TetR/AcrR family transcriptional regulator [Aurantimicrobium sp. MWH-Uga1]AXE54297.1 HTH-type transcriptional regulator AcrR [Aurantimicrobium sp. MWH-Uga1]
MPSPASGLKTRQSLIDAAKGFLGQGNRDVSIQEIAKAANVSVGSVYTYFKDKNELFDAAAADALMDNVPQLEKILSGIDDSALGFLATGIWACRRPSFSPELARIILTVGPLGFARFDDYFQGPIQAIQQSVDRGLCHCEDIEAFVLAASGAYQNILAHVYAGTASEDLAERVYWQFAKELGYSREQYQEVIDYVASLPA